MRLERPHSNRPPEDRSWLRIESYFQICRRSNPADAGMDRVVDAMLDAKFEIIATNLSKDQEQKLREALGQDEPSL